MHFEAAPALITLALTTATTSVPIRGRRPYTHPGRAGNPPHPSGSDGLPDCLNHERLGDAILRWGLLASAKRSGHDADTLQIDFGGGDRGRGFCRRERISCPTGDPRRLDHSRRGIEILDD